MPVTVRPPRPSRRLDGLLWRTYEGHAFVFDPHTRGEDCVLLRGLVLVFFFCHRALLLSSSASAAAAATTILKILTPEYLTAMSRRHVSFKLWFCGE